MAALDVLASSVWISMWSTSGRLSATSVSAATARMANPAAEVVRVQPVADLESGRPDPTVQSEHADHRSSLTWSQHIAGVGALIPLFFGFAST